MTGSLAVDAGQSGIRLRFDGPDGSAQASVAGVLTDRPLSPQFAAVITDFCRSNTCSPDQVGIGSSGLVDLDAGDLLALLPSHVSTVALAHDATTSYLGALGNHPGVVIAAGTGVVTLAVGAEAVARVDGWGHLLGDAGSGFWLGRAGMQAAMRAFDGRGEPTALLELLREQFPEPAVAYVDLQSDPRRVSRIADFARTVDAAAEAGDPVADRILAEGAAELSEAVITGLRRVDLMGELPPRVCALGEVFRSKRIHSRFVGYLRLHWPTLELTPPTGSALDGAAATLSLDPSSPLASLISLARR